MAELRIITEDNFIDAFNLELAPGQEEFVSHPVRSLAKAYVYRDQCQPCGRVPSCWRRCELVVSFPRAASRR